MEHLASKDIQKIKKILKKNQVKRAALFGSFAKGKAKKSSDVDLLVEFRGKKSLFDLAGLKIELEDSIGKNFDIVTFSSLHPYLKKKIIAEQIQII